MANTYVAIATTTVGAGGAANITFSSIPGTYTDIAILLSGRSARTGTYGELLKIDLNGSSANFSGRALEGDGTTASSYTGTSNGIGTVTSVDATASTFSNTLIYIPNYTSSNYKSISVDNVNENNATATFLTLVARLWSNSAAITSVALYPNANNFVQYSSATLYGISATV